MKFKNFQVVLLIVKLSVNFTDFIQKSKFLFQTSLSFFADIEK